MIRPVDLVRSPPEVDIGGTRQLLGAAGTGGVGHFLYVSIVGVQHTRLPYARLKATAEDLLRQSGVPHSIVAATQFYWLLDRMLGRMARLPVWPLPVKLPMQPGTRASSRHTWSTASRTGRAETGSPSADQTSSASARPPSSTRQPGNSSPASCRCRSLLPPSARPATSPVPKAAAARRPGPSG